MGGPLRASQLSSRRRASLLRRVLFENGHVDFVFRNGRQVSRPLADFPRLQSAKLKQRRNYRIRGRGVFATWPTLDEDIGAASLLKTREETIARLAKHNVRRAAAAELIRSVETKQDVVTDIARLIGRPPRPLGPGSKELKRVLIDVVEALSLPIDLRQSKPVIASAIVRTAGLRWTPDSDSRRSPSGGGSTITRLGLQRLRNAVAKLKSK